MQADEKAKISSLIDVVVNYYESQRRQCVLVGSGIQGGETLHGDFLIDRRLVARIVIPIDTRNFHAALLIGVGPCFVHPMHLMDYTEASRYSMNSDEEALLKNLKLLDEHVDRGLIPS